MSPAIVVWPMISIPNHPTPSTRVCPARAEKLDREKVLIVGAGPVGLIIGCYLNKYGIDFDIIDKNTRSTARSKALSVSPATIKAFHGLGLAGELIARESRFSQSTLTIKTANSCISITADSPPVTLPCQYPAAADGEDLETALADAGRRSNVGTS